MSAGRVQLAAKGLQDQYLTGSPQMSFFNTAFIQHTPFLIKVKEIPFNNSTIPFSSSQVCEITKAGDVIRSITLKMTLPSMFQTGYGLAYPSAIKNPTFYYLDAGYNVISMYFARNIRHFFTNNDTNWLPPVVSYGQNGFLFSGTASYIGFTDLPSALFWGFKNYINYVNGFYIWKFTSQSELSYFSAGWVQANSNYFRYYAQNAPATLLKNVDLYIGGQLIESIPSQYLQIWNDINYENAQQPSIARLTGTAFIPSTSDIDYYVKIPFSLDNIPAASITTQTIEVRVQIGSYASILDANAASVTNFSNTVSIPGAVSATTDGTYDYVATASALNTYFAGKLVQSFPYSGITSIVSDTINVYALVNGTSIVQYQPKTNVSNVINIGQTVGYGGSSCLTTGPTGLYAYTNQNSLQALIGGQFKAYEFPYSSPYLVTTYNGQAFLAIPGPAVVVQNLTTPYISTKYTLAYGSPVQMASNPSYGMYLTTANSLVSWTGSGFVQIASLPAAPNCLVTTTICNILFFPSSVWIISGSIQKYSLSFTALAALYVSGSTLLVSSLTGGIGTWNYTSASVAPGLVNQNVYYSSIFAGASNLYATDTTSTIWQFLNYGTIVAQNTKIQTNLPPNQKFIFAYDPKTNFAYFTSTTSTTMYYLVDGYPNTTNTLQTLSPTTTVSGLTKLFFDGQYVYSFPNDGSSTGYKLNTFSDFRSVASHYTTTILDNTGKAKPMYTGAMAFDGQYIIITPLASSLDTNITVYNSFLPFVEPISFYQYDGFLDAGYDYSSIVTFGNKMFIGSNTQIYNYNSAPGFKVAKSSALINLFSFGSITDGKDLVYIFNSNLQSNGITKYSISTDSITKDNSAFLNYAGTYGVIVQPNSDQAFLVPKDNANLLLYSISTSNVVNIPLNGNNLSNTACIAGNNLYIFPSTLKNNLYVVNLTNYLVSNIWLQANNYQGATYDGSKYIYLTDPIGNIFRFNTTTDIFNDIPGWSVGTPSTRLNFTMKGTTVTGNVIFIANQNIYTSNILTRVTTNNWINGVTSAVSTRQPMNNIVYFSTTSNIYRYSANTGGSNLATTYLLDRTTNPNKTVLDITCGLSNVFISWSDGTLGTLDTTSNDLNGIYYYKSSPAQINSAPTTSVILNSNVYFLTNDNVSRISTGSSTIDQRLAGPPGPSNIYSIAVALNNNVYAFPSNGNVIVRVSDMTQLSTLDRLTAKFANVGCVTIYGSTIYAFSKTSNAGIAINSTIPLSTSSSVQYSNSAAQNNQANGFSCCFVYSDSNLYMIPYASNTVASYSLSTFNFINSTTYTPLIGQVSNVVSGSNSWVIAQNGYLSNLNAVVPVSDILTGRLAYQSTQSSSNMLGWYFTQTLGATKQAYGPIVASNSFIDTYIISPSTVTPTVTSGYYAMWISKTPLTTFTYATANITNHSWYNLVFTITAPAGYTASLTSFVFKGICTTGYDIVNAPIPSISILQNGVVVNTVTPSFQYTGDSLYLTIYSTGLAYSVNGTIGSQTVSVNVTYGQGLYYVLPSTSLALAPKTFSVTSDPNTFWRVYIFSEPANISMGMDYYWTTQTNGIVSPCTVQTAAGNFFNTANIIPSFNGSWLATQDGSSIINAQPNAISIIPQTYTGALYDSTFLAGSNLFLANSTTGNYLQKYNLITQQSSTITYPYSPIVDINVLNQYLYILSENAGITTLGVTDYNNVLLGTIDTSGNVVTARLSFPITDSMIYIQSNPWSNISAASPSRFKSFDYVSNWGILLQQYSCVLPYNGVYYVTPTSGNVIIQISTQTVSQLTGQYIRGYDVSNIIPGPYQTNYTIQSTTDQFSNVLFTCVNNITKAVNVVAYNTTLDLYASGAWSARQGGSITSNVSLYLSGFQYVFSNVDSNIMQFPYLGYASPYYFYQYPVPSVFSNVCSVIGSNAYIFPSIAGSNIIAFNLNNKIFSNIGHDQMVLAVANVAPYTVIVNPTKINVFQTSTFTSLTNIPFTSTAVSNASTFYDGRYLNVMTPAGTVIFDFTSLSTASRPITTSRYYNTMQALGGNIYTSNALLGYSPRPYTEVNIGPATGLITSGSNLYGKVSNTIQNITTGTILATSTTTPANDSLIQTNQMYVLSSDAIVTLNVLSSASSLTFLKPSEYSSEILTDGSYIYVPSTATLNVWRMNTTSYQTTVAQSTFVSTSKTYVNQYFENGSMVLTTDQNQQVVYNPNTTSSGFMSSTFLPNQLQNNYASIVVGTNMYIFPGNAKSSLLQIYNTTLPFNLTTSYSLLDIGFNDIRYVGLNGATIVGTPYTTTNMIIFNTQTNIINSYYLETTANVTANGYISAAVAGQTYILTPRSGLTIQKVLTNQLITSKSFGTNISMFPEKPANPFISLTSYGKTLAALTYSNLYLFDMTNPPNILIPSTSVYSSPMNPATVYYDGRFIKIIANAIKVYDTIPLTVPTNMQMSCLVRAAYVGTNERNWMQNSILDYVFTQIQTSNITSQGYYKLSFTGPTTELVCTSTSNIQSMELLLNGYSKSPMDANYLSNLVPYWYYPRTPSSQIYIMPFEPYVNMSRIKEPVVFVSGQVNIFAKTLNVFRVKNGMGGVMFN
jgi:hypothetical protein